MEKLMNYFKAFFIFFVLFTSSCRAENSWGDETETESIDSGDVDTGDVSDKEVSEEKKNLIEESAQTRTKEALKGFLEDAFGEDE
ncbi:MAG: hypothetical protein ACRCYZ_02525 [Alphaproteobacteria bacterium]